MVRILARKERQLIWDWMHSRCVEWNNKRNPIVATSPVLMQTGGGKYAGERLSLSMEIPPRRPTFTRNTYPRRFQPGPTLALPPLSTRSYLSPPSPDFDPANTLPPALSSRIENFLPSSFPHLFLISLLVISLRF